MKPDRTLPHAPEAEEAVIGTVLSYPDSINAVVNILSPEMFTRPELRTVFEVCRALVQKNIAVDFVVVSVELRKRGVAGETISDIMELTSRIMSDELIETHALLIKQMFMLRQYAEVGARLVEAAHAGDIDTITENIEANLLSIGNMMQRKEPRKLGPLVDEVLVRIQKVIDGKIEFVGVPSGFTLLDRLTGGFMKGQLTIIAGRTSMGKTAVAVQIAKNAAELGHGVGFFSMEMSGDELAQRFLSNVSDYTNVDLTRGRCEMKTLCDSSNPLLELGIFIDDTSNISLIELRAKARRLIHRHSIKLIIVDYLQLMKSTGQNREQEVSSISRGLKAIAKDNDIPVIALSQLNREPEGRADKKPLLSDLRESGAIEQDADRVIMVYRPAYYGEKYEGDQPTDNLLLLMLVKNRNGACGKIDLKHNTSITKIYD
jgi:replicative DNA helicase